MKIHSYCFIHEVNLFQLASWESQYNIKIRKKPDIFLKVNHIFILFDVIILERMGKPKTALMEMSIKETGGKNSHLLIMAIITTA